MYFFFLLRGLQPEAIFFHCFGKRPRNKEKFNFIDFIFHKKYREYHSLKQNNFLFKITKIKITTK